MTGAPHPFPGRHRLLSRLLDLHYTFTINSPDFRKYWDEMPPIRSYNDSVNGTSRATGVLRGLGYTHVVATA